MAIVIISVIWVIILPVLSKHHVRPFSNITEPGRGVGDGGRGVDGVGSVYELWRGIDQGGIDTETGPAPRAGRASEQRGEGRRH